MLAAPFQAAAASSYETVTVKYVPLHYVFDGAAYEPPQGEEGFLYKNRTYVPLRFVVELLGGVVRWDGSNQTVSVTEPFTDQQKQRIEDYRAERRIAGEDEPAAEPEKAQFRQLRVQTASVRYIFFGNELQPGEDMTSFLIGGRLYVPLRFMAESLGRQIEFDQTTYTIAAASPAPSSPDKDEHPAEEKGTEPEDAYEDGDAELAPPVGVPGGGGAPGGGIPGGGGSAPEPSKEEYDRIVARHEKQIADLRLACENKLVTLYKQYQNASTDEEQAAAIAAGFAALAECDASFDSIMNSLENELSRGGHSTAIISGYYAQYENEKEEQKRKLLNK